MTKSEEAFLRAVNRDRNRCNLAYFFGILKNIQQEIDDQRYQQYCWERYNHELHLENQRRQAESQNGPTVEGILKLMITAMNLSQDFLKKSAFNKCKSQIKQLLSSINYVGPLIKKFHEALGSRNDLDLDQKEQAFHHVEQFINEATAAA